MTRSAALFVMPLTMWTIGLVSTISQFVLPPVQAGGYGFSYVSLAMIHFAPMIGTVAAELWGHWFNDFIATRYMKSHGGTHSPENLHLARMGIPLRNVLRLELGLY